MNERMSVGTMIVLRPLQSARNPQRCELAMIPMDEMPDSTPLCCVVRAKSHSATGNTKLMPMRRELKVCGFINCSIHSPSVSKDVAVMMIPATKMMT